MSRRAIGIAFVGLALLFCTLTLAVWADPGPTDSYGCHVNPNTGQYHCHP